MDVIGKVMYSVAAWIFVVFIFSLPLAFLVMMLWNAVMVDLFSSPVLSFRDAWLLYFLCGLLLKSPSVNLND